MGSQIKLIFLCLILAMLGGCSGGQTSAQLEISTSSITTGASFTGGFMVIGESTTGKKFSVAFHGTNQTKIKLDSGIWKFAAVGWDGAGTGVPFEGTPYCGGLSDFNLSEQNSTINLDITAANCSSPLLASIQMKPLLGVYGCNIFYSYNGLTDEFTPLEKEHNISFCMQSQMPADYVTKFTRFRITALAITSPTDIKPAFTSECKLVTTTGMPLPAGKFPFTISLYKTDEDCTNKRAAQTYNFFNGLSEGDASFDSLYSPGTETLLLATSNTKRGKSPFMTEIPRILCGTYPNLTDCMAEPTPAAHINVNFQSGNHFNEQVLLKNITPSITTCPATILSQSKYFETDACEIDERNVFIRPYRNEFMCQNSLQSTSFFEPTFTIKDIHKKGNLVYFLQYDGVNSRVSAYTDKGKFLYQMTLGSLTGGYASKIAANADGSKVVLANSTKIFFYSVNNGFLTEDGSATISVQDIEMNALGSHIYTLIGGEVQARSISVIPTVLSSITLTNPITDLKFHNNKLYLLENSPLNPDYIHSATASAGTLGTPLLVTANASNFEFFEVNDKKLVVFSTGTYFVRDLQTNIESNSISHSGSGISGPIGVTFIKDKILIASGSKIRMLDMEGSANVAQYSGSCSETLTVSHGGVAKTLTIQSIEDQPLSGLFQDTLEILGRRFFNDLDKPFYYFQSLAHNDDRTTGGELRRIQEMLGPQALGGFFPEYATCSDVVAAAPFIKNLVYRDETTGENMTFTLKVNKSTEVIGNFNCSATVGSCPSTGNTYDLRIDFEKTSGDLEKMRIKLKCGKELGSFESFETEPGRTSRELYLYYTETDASSRFEKYSYDIENETRAEVMKVYKPTDDIVKARKVHVSVNVGNNKHASVLELNRNEAYIFENRINISKDIPYFMDNDPTYVFPYASLTFNEARDNLEMATNSETQNPSACSILSNTNPNGATDVACLFGDFDTIPLSRGSGIYLHPAALNIENPVNVMTMGVFEIP